MRGRDPRNHHDRLNGDDAQESTVYGQNALYRLSTYYDDDGKIHHALFLGEPVVEIDEPEPDDDR